MQSVAAAFSLSKGSSRSGSVQKGMVGNEDDKMKVIDGEGLPERDNSGKDGGGETLQTARLSSSEPRSQCGQLF